MLLLEHDRIQLSTARRSHNVAKNIRIDLQALKTISTSNRDVPAHPVWHAGDMSKDASFSELT
jgi:hypothetical protein